MDNEQTNKFSNFRKIFEFAKKKASEEAFFVLQ